MCVSTARFLTHESPLQHRNRRKKTTNIKSTNPTWYICAGAAAAADFDELLNETRRKADAAVVAAGAITVAY